MDYDPAPCCATQRYACCSVLSLLCVGGPGFSVPIGLFMAAVSVAAGISRMIPTWLALFGLILALAGELS